MEASEQEGLVARQAVGAELTRIHAGLGASPERAAVLLHLGRLALAAGLNEQAEAFFKELTDLEAGLAEAWMGRGEACLFLGWEEEALVCLERAMALDGDLPEAAFRRAQVLQGLGRAREALEWYQRVEGCSVHRGKARMNEALIALQQGFYELGWESYESRWEENPGMEQRAFAGALWLGKEELRGRTLLLHAEQGLGDTLQFLRYAVLCYGLGAKLYLEVQAPLKGLVAGSGLAVETLAFGEPLPEHDFHCPLCSLPLAFWRRGVRSIPQAQRYLRAPSGAGLEALRRVGAAGGRLRVGVAWRGNPRHPRDWQRSIPAADFRLLLGRAGISFFGLQLRPESETEIEVASGDYTDLASEIADFCDTAAVLESLDLVICVDTALAHLAGALGRPVWVLLPKHADWRWGTQGEHSEWYPTARLFRQETRGDWSGLLARVAGELERWEGGRQRGGRVF